jgi:hypothetical protein
MHAKMTRDRKKNFISTIETTIEELERDIQKMRDVLNKVGSHQQVLVTAPVTPLLTPRHDSSPVKREKTPSFPIKAPAAAPVQAPFALASSLGPIELGPVPSSSSQAPVTLASVPSPSPQSTARPPSFLLPSLAAAIVSGRNPITMANPENSIKRRKASHGFSWNG